MDEIDYRRGRVIGRADAAIERMHRRQTEEPGSDLVAFLRARLDEDEQIAELVARSSIGPGRGLRDVAAKRRVLGRHQPRSPAFTRDPAQCNHCADLCHSETGLLCEPVVDALWPCDEVRDLAAPYADHPDYRAAWAPAEVHQAR